MKEMKEAERQKTNKKRTVYYECVCILCVCVCVCLSRIRFKTLYPVLKKQAPSMSHA